MNISFSPSFKVKLNARTLHALSITAPFALVSLLAILDAAAGRNTVLAGLLTIGPCLIAATATPRQVIDIGAYAAFLTLIVSFPDHMWWTRQQLFFLLAIAGVTIASSWMARRREIQEKLAAEAKEEELQAIRASLAKSEFLSRMSHELRTPLAAILGFAEILSEEQNDLTAPHSEMVKRINRAGQHLMTLINDVLDISRIETGRLSISPEPVMLFDAVKQSFNLIGSVCSERSIATFMDIDKSLWVLADRSRLQQVLVNLLSNATKYNHTGGHIAVTAIKDHNTIRICVSDSGVGIDISRTGDLFTPFARLGAELTKTEGTGLGLSLSKALVETMGGTIELLSTGDSGTTFAFTLPVADFVDLREEIQNDESKEIAERLYAVTASIACIEDNPDNMQLFKQILAKFHGLKVLEAFDGDEGVILVTQAKPDLVFLDLHLPGKDGRSVLAALSANPDTQNIPVVILTADAMGSSRQELIALGAAGYLTKPFSFPDVLRLIDELLKHRTTL